MQTRERKNDVNQDYLQSMFTYDNGELYWKNHIFTNKNGTKLGHQAPSGYKHCRVNGVDFDLHRIIYVYHHGDIPIGLDIDHKDRIRNNNDINNLRLLTRSQNNLNSERSISAKGYWMDGKKFRVQVSVDGKKKHIGNFKTEQEAKRAFANHKNLLMRGM